MNEYFADYQPEVINNREYYKQPRVPKKICVVTGSGNSVVEQIASTGSDTLITGELKQHFYNFAQEKRLNLYACGHYATETFGVDALAREASSKFDLPYQFIATDCPL